MAGTVPCAKTQNRAFTHLRLTPRILCIYDAGDHDTAGEKAMTDRNPIMTGGCQCGAVRYTLYAVPTRASVCYCRMCQKASGNYFLPLAGVKRDEFAWTRGSPGTFRSSELVERDFCPKCGTPL